MLDHYAQMFSTVKCQVLISAPRLGVYYFFVVDSVCPSVCLSVCHAPSNCFFFFVSRWNRAIFGRQFSMWHSAKLFSSIFDLGPLKPIIYSQKLKKKSTISRLVVVWHIDRRRLHPTGGFRGWPIRRNHTKNVVGPTLVATKFGLRAEIYSPTGLYSLLLVNRYHLLLVTFLR